MKSCLTPMFVLLIASVAFPQSPPIFQDDLLDHLVGKWDATGTVHDRPSRQTFEVDWVLNHQFLRIHEKSVENIAGRNVPFEAMLFIGYDKTSKRYVLHSMSVFGGGRPGELAYGQRSGNEIKFDEEFAGRRGHGRFIWQPESKTWHYVTGVENANGELQTAVDLKLTPAVDKGFTALPPGEATDMFLRAERALIEADFDEAKRAAERAIELAPDYPPVYGLYRDALNAQPRLLPAFEHAERERLVHTLRRVRRAQAAARYKELAGAEPDRAAYWYALVWLSPDTPERKAAAERLLRLEPTSPWAYHASGLAALVMNDPKLAASNLEKAHAMAPGEPSITRSLIFLYSDTPGREADARKLLEELIKAAPGRYDTYMALGPLVLGASDPEKTALAKRYTDMFPQDRHAHLMYGFQLAALAAKDKAAAAARAREAIASLPGPRFAEGRAYLFERYVLQPTIGQGEAAVGKLAAEVLASKETSPQVFLALGRAYTAETAGHALALRLLTRGYENWQSLSGPARTGDDLRLEIGRVHLRLGDAARAAEFLGAVTSDDLVPEVAFDLGRAHTKLGDSAKAFDAFARAVAAEPSPERVTALSAAARAASRTAAEASAAVWAIRDTTAKPASPFTYAALDGKQVSLADYRGKVVLLTFWFPS